MSTPADIRAAVSESSLAGGGVAPPAYTAPPVRTDAVPLEPSAPALALAPTAAAAEAAGITDFGPNVSSDADNFFQSDRDIELQRARKEKERRFGARGRPLQLPSKVLALELVQPPSVVVPDSAQLLDQAAADGANGLQELQEIEVSWAYVGESGHVARKVDLETGAVLGVFRGHTGPVTSLAVAYDARGRDAALFTGSWDKTIRKWNASDSSQIMCIRYHSDFVKSIRLHGSVLFSASADKTICMWNADTGAHVRTLRGHTRAVEDIVLSANGRILFSASSDTTVRKWDTNTGQVLAVLTGHQTSVYSLTLTADGSELWSGALEVLGLGSFYADADFWFSLLAFQCRPTRPPADGILRWDGIGTGYRISFPACSQAGQTNACTCSFEHPDFVRSVLVIGESGLIATGSRDENVRIWNTAVCSFPEQLEA
nr:hypothetical protein HK105_006692 [Polyrhizophydium stewartii]